MTFTLYLTAECNFKCVYCYENFQNKMNLSSDNAYKIIDFIMHYTDEKIEIVFMGGEPLIRKELIVDIIDYINKQYSNREVIYNLTTNASLLDDDMINLFKREKFEIRLSIDGNKNTHEINRISKNGVHYFDKIMENAHKMNRKGIPYSARMTVTANTLKSLYENICYFHENAINSIFIGINCNWKMNPQELKQFKEQLYKIKHYYISEFDKDNKLEIAQFDGRFLDIMCKFGNCFNMCSAGRDTFKIFPDLKIYPCEYVVCKEQFCIGNINDGINTSKSIKLAYDLYDKKNNKCDSCEIKDYCFQMKCGYSNYVATGRINIPGEQDCIVEKMYYPIVRDILMHLAERKYERLYFYKEYIKKNEMKLNQIGNEVFNLLKVRD